MLRRFVLMGLSAAALVSLPCSMYAEDDALWFPVGERMMHRIYWGGMPVGQSVTETSWVEEGGRRLLAIRMRTRTNRFFDKIRPVDDAFESIVDPDTFLPVRFERVIKRRRLVCNEVTTFDFEKLEATWTSPCLNKTKIFAIEPDTRDILTFLYLIRKSSLPEQQVVERKVMADEGLFALMMKTGNVEEVTLPNHGNVKGLRVDPVFDFDGLLVDKGTFILWVSQDQRRLLARAVIKRYLGDIKIILCSVSGPGDDLWIKNSESEETSEK